MASALALDSVRPAGALHVVGGGTVVVASSFAQARLTFEAVKNSLEVWPESGLAGFRATSSRRITGLTGTIVYVIRFKNLLLHQ